MSNRLEDFVNNNREDFDKFVPGPVVWHNIQQELKKPAAKKGILISIKALKWSAAAAVIIMLVTGTYLFINSTGKSQTDAQKGVAKINNPEKATEQPVTKIPDTSAKIITIHHNTASDKVNDNSQLATNDDADNNEELYHYTRLVELKQNEIKKIKKDEPLLYQQFAGDFSKLDSTFHRLKKQLPLNPNREQILEAMIQNLQYQETLLNQQLNIIKKINNTKKQEYEKVYKTV